MTNNTIQPLLTGTLFVIIGLCTIKFSKKKKLAGLISLTIGAAVILFTTVGPLAKSKAQINKVLKLDKDDITSVIIEPTKYRGYEKISLIQREVEITDKGTIDRLCSSLAHARETSSFIQSPKWVCLIKFVKIDNSFLEVQVKHAGTDTFIEVKSDGDYGWNYGAIDAKVFGQILSGIVLRSRLKT